MSRVDRSAEQPVRDGLWLVRDRQTGTQEFISGQEREERLLSAAGVIAEELGYSGPGEMLFDFMAQMRGGRNSYGDYNNSLVSAVALYKEKTGQSLWPLLNARHPRNVEK